MNDKELTDMVMACITEERMQLAKAAKEWQPSDSERHELAARHELGYTVLSTYQTRNQVRYWQ